MLVKMITVKQTCSRSLRMEELTSKIIPDVAELREPLVELD